MTLMLPASGMTASAEAVPMVLAYAGDAATQAALDRAALNLALPGFEVRRGDIHAARRDLASAPSPQLLFVDVSGIGQVLDAVQALSDVCEPQLQLVVVGDVNDVSLFRGLLRLGVSDYLFKPVTAEMVEQLVARLLGGPAGGLAGGLAQGTQGRLGKLVAVTGARGGTGTSSIAASLADYLAERGGRRVLLLDMDTATGAQPLLLGAEARPGLAEALAAPERVDDLFIERAIVPAGNRLDLMASQLAASEDSPISLEAAHGLISRLQRAYHYIIADVPLVAERRCRALLDIATVEVLTSEATLLAARDTQARQARAQAGRQILVHNRAGRPGDLTAEQFAASLRQPPDVAVPFLPQVFARAINLGEAAWRGDARAEAAIASLAQELSGQAVAPAPAPAWQRWLGLAP